MQYPYNPRNQRTPEEYITHWQIIMLLHFDPAHVKIRSFEK